MTAEVVITSIVEGYGEVYALRPLVQRIAGELFGDWSVDVTTPHRISRGRMLKDEVVRAARLQMGRVATKGGVIVVLDSDDDCPVELASSIMDLIGDDKVHVAVAVREFEAWFLAGIESLRDHRAVRGDAIFAGDPDVPRDAKGRLEAQMVEAYRETIHQPAFASILDLSLAQRSRSFRHLVTSIGKTLH